MTNKEIFTMSSIMLPLFWFIFHFLGLITAVKTLPLIIIIGLLDAIISAGFIGIIIDVSFMKGSIVKFKKLAISLIIILCLIDFIWPVNWMGFITTLICTGAYAVIWWGTNGGSDYYDPPEPIDWYEYMTGRKR